MSAAPEPQPSAIVHLLPSGRTVHIDDHAREQVEVRSPTGEVELRIELTDAGPVLRMRAARLELSADEAVAIDAPDVRLHATEGMSLRSDGDLVVSGAEATLVASGDGVHILGQTIHLN